MDIGFAELAYTTHRGGVKKLEMGNQATVFGAFAKLWKATISSVMPVSLSVHLSLYSHLRPHGKTGLLTDEFA